MAIYRIPLPKGIPQFTQKIILDNETYILRCHWNEREEAWYFAIEDADENPIVSGRKMVSNWPLLHRSISTDLPAGQLFVIDTTDSLADPGLNDLDERVVLLYFDAVSMAAAGAS